MLIVIVECAELLRQVGGITTSTNNNSCLLHRGHFHFVPLLEELGDFLFTLITPLLDERHR
jgi:hypothetical protein